MTWKLFLDDIRFPEDVRHVYPQEGEWVIARNMNDAIWYIERRGLPNFISFDHDLADEHYLIGQDPSKMEKTGYEFAKWLSNHIMDKDLKIPTGFGYHVHSMNPVGKQNIESYMRNFIKQRIYNA